MANYQGDSDHKISRVSRRDVHFGVNSRFLYTLMYPQSGIEAIFRAAMGSGEKVIRSLTVGPQLESESLKPRKVVVEQGIHPIQLSVSPNSAGPDNYPVTVVLESADGKSETVRAKYVVGCDGAHSWIRTQLGIDMVGETSSECSAESRFNWVTYSCLKDTVFGVIDTWVDTDFPDIRNLSVIENNGRVSRFLTL